MEECMQMIPVWVWPLFFLGRDLENNCILEICQEQSSGVVYIYCYHEYSRDFTNYLYSNT